MSKFKKESQDARRHDQQHAAHPSESMPKELGKSDKKEKPATHSKKK